MSPTLLELIVAILLVWVAWKIGVWLAPRLFGSFVSARRNARQQTEAGFRPQEKNITPESERVKTSPSSHGNDL